MLKVARCGNAQSFRGKLEGHLGMDIDVSLAKAVAAIAKDATTTVAVVVGGIWALWKFAIRREAHPKIQFSVELNVLGPLGDRIVVEVAALLENKGVVRHQITNFVFSLLYLPEGAPLQEEEAFNGQVQFREAVSKRSWINPDYEYVFVDPTNNAKIYIRHITSCGSRVRAYPCSIYVLR